MTVIEEVKPVVEVECRDCHKSFPQTKDHYYETENGKLRPNCITCYKADAKAKRNAKLGTSSAKSAKSGVAPDTSLMVVNPSAKVVEGIVLYNPEAEPLMRDLDLADRAGLEQPRAIRRTITALLKSGDIGYGTVRSGTDGTQSPVSISEALVYVTKELVHSGTGTVREFDTYYLNEFAIYQVLFQLQTPAARDFRKQVTQILANLRRGGNVPSPAAPTPALQQAITPMPEPTMVTPQETAIQAPEQPTQALLHAMKMEEAKFVADLYTREQTIKLCGPDWCKSKIEYVTAIVLNLEPDQKAAPRQLCVQTIFREKGIKLSDDDLKKHSQCFGMALAAAYRNSNGGNDPPKVMRIIGNVQRNVAVYTESDRPWIEEVWKTYSTKNNLVPQNGLKQLPQQTKLALV